MNAILIFRPIKFLYLKRILLVGWIVRLVTISVETMVEFISILMIFGDPSYLLHLSFSLYLGVSIVLNLYFWWVVWLYGRTSIYPSRSRVMVFNMNVNEMNNYNPYFFSQPQPQQVINRRVYQVPNDNVNLDFYSKNPAPVINQEINDEEELKRNEEQIMQLNNERQAENKLMSNDELKRLFNLPPKSASFLPPIAKKPYVKFDESGPLNFYKK